jgi:hypothetical protein
MQRRNLIANVLILVAVAALSLMCTVASVAGSRAQDARYDRSVLHVTIAMTGHGIVATPNSLRPGNHLLTIKNNTRESRGIEMIGTD